MTREQRRLLKEAIENEAKSPEVISAIVTVNSRTDAYGIAGIFEEITKSTLPFELDEWQRTIRKLPVELYFLFKKKRELVLFARTMKKEFPDIFVDF